MTNEFYRTPSKPDVTISFVYFVLTPDDNQDNKSKIIYQFSANQTAGGHIQSRMTISANQTTPGHKDGHNMKTFLPAHTKSNCRKHTLSVTIPFYNFHHN